MVAVTVFYCTLICLVLFFLNVICMVFKAIVDAILYSCVRIIIIAFYACVAMLGLFMLYMALEEYAGNQLEILDVINIVAIVSVGVLICYFLWRLLSAFFGLIIQAIVMIMEFISDELEYISNTIDSLSMKFFSKVISKIGNG